MYLFLVEREMLSLQELLSRREAKMNENSIEMRHCHNTTHEPKAVHESVLLFPPFTVIYLFDAMKCQSRCSWYNTYNGMETLVTNT